METAYAASMVDEELDVVVGVKLVREKQSSLAHKLFVRIGGAVCVVTPIFAIAGLHPVFTVLIELLGAAMLVLGLGLGGGAQRWKVDIARRRVTIDEHAILVDGKQPVPRAAVRYAYLQPHGDGPALRCENERGDVLFETRGATPEATAALLEAVGGERLRRTWVATSPLVASLPRFWASLAAVPILAWLGWSAGMAASGPMLALLGMFVAGIAATFPLATSSDAVVGADGIALRWFSFVRFVPWSQITAIVPSGRGVRLSVEGARDVRVGPVGPDGQRGAAFVEQMRDAWGASKDDQPGATRARLVDRLARGGRPVRAWHADLRALDARDGAYRVTAMRAEDLWRVVTDAGETEETRAAAAVALRARGEAERLRIAAEDVASPRLRVVLERAADARTDDAAIVEALAEIESGKARALGSGPSDYEEASSSASSASRRRVRARTSSGSVQGVRRSARPTSV